MAGRAGFTTPVNVGTVGRRTLVTPHGQGAQRSATTPGQKQILDALELPEPPQFFDLTACTTS